MEEFCRSQQEALEELERVAPGVPFLALGQTVFWDEPLKAGVIQTNRRLGLERPFVSGVHDTDYFAKYPHAKLKSGFAALPHNDTTTKALWSAAGEFSALFGSETVVSRDKLAAAGGKVARVATKRPGYLDEITEAWGWRGIVSYERGLKTTSEKPLRRLFDTLNGTYEWAIDTSLELIAGPEHEEAAEAADQLKAMACYYADDLDTLTLADYFVRIAPEMYNIVAGEDVGVETTKTTELLRFNTKTCGQKRFGLLSIFIDPATRDKARKAYDKAVEGTQIYPLDRFGAGALPFDVLIPGAGRGTLRLGKRGGLIMTDEPVTFSFKKPVDTVERLAEVLEAKFGPDVVIVGKAVSLIGMLASEYVFVFHEGASGYMPISRQFHKGLAEAGVKLELNPILRVRYEPWDALIECRSWFRLPEPLRRPFGVDEMSAESFAKRWRDVAGEQEKLMATLSELHRPLDLIKFLDKNEGGQWSTLAEEYLTLHECMACIDQTVKEVRERRAVVVQEYKGLKALRVKAEKEKGRHWREKMFEKDPTSDDLKKREELTAKVEKVIAKIEECRGRWRELYDEQETMVGSEHTMKSRKRRRDIGFEAELMRMKLIRSAVIATEGLRNAGYRPAAWWFHLVCQDGCWYESTMKRAYYYLEPLT